MTESQFASLYAWDHGQFHAFDGPDEFWNITPRLIETHRKKTRADISTIAHIKRVSLKHEKFRANRGRLKSFQKELDS